MSDLVNKEPAADPQGFGYGRREESYLRGIARAIHLTEYLLAEDSTAARERLARG